MLVDSHCHLNYAGLVEDQVAVLARARARGVSTMLNISTRESEWDAVVGTAEREEGVWASIGIHPHEADAHPDVDTAKLIAASGHSRVVAIGETGLDYYYDHSDRDRQKASFRAHIAASRDTGLPLIVHTPDFARLPPQPGAVLFRQRSPGGIARSFWSTDARWGSPSNACSSSR